MRRYHDQPCGLAYMHETPGKRSALRRGVRERPIFAIDPVGGQGTGA